VCGSGAVVCSWFLLIRGAQRARHQAETPPIVLCRFPGPALTTRRVGTYRPTYFADHTRAERWHRQVLAEFDWNQSDPIDVISQPIVAVEEIMPRAIKTQQVTEKTTVAVVITAVICLILIVAAMEAPIKFVLP
jgi:hypothetical protein